jgi:hypothetical protein
MVVENLRVFALLSFMQEILVLLYLPPRGELAEVSLRDVARFGSPLADIACLLGHDVW